MNGHEIRERFLAYFEKNSHKRVHSSPLLPANDPTLLFVNAGMNQFKDVFLGNDKRDYNRAASSQKCIRAGGKHNDLDEVGRTARHHTFFEMLGNFSFGDYFKEDAVKFAWDFLTGTVEEGKLGLDPEYLWFTYFEGDDDVPADTEARDLWIKAGAKPERVLAFDAKDNFWQMGDTGPCGPCSEIHYYMGDEPGNPEKNRPEFVNAETGDDTIEIWNLVFMQFDKDSDGNLTDLPAPSVDTGMGLERVAAVMQGKKSNYESDLIKPIVDYVAEISPRIDADSADNASEDEVFSCRVIADHARSAAFAICDGILPGNEGRSYVLRKIMRRAIYHGREHLGFEEAFFYKICDFVIEEMKGAFPELEIQQDFIAKMVRLEEERFGNTLTVGLKKLGETTSGEDFAGGWNSDTLTKVRKQLAALFDTYGTPRDLIRVKLEDEFDVEIKEDEFNASFDAAIKELQQESGIGKTQQAEKINPIYKKLEDSGSISEFRGYETTEVENTEVVAIVKDNEKTESLDEGEEGLIILNETPFYAESGGQVGDVGDLTSSKFKVQSSKSEERTQTSDLRTQASFARAKVLDTFAPIAGIVLHKSRVEKGSIKTGDRLSAKVDVANRDAIRRNHTATHLVHAALKEVLGTHVKQAGSVVAPGYLRFDFTHYQAMTSDELNEVEDLVNHYILQNETVSTDMMSIEEAMRSGAVAMFGEKYGSDVRVLSVGDGEFSKELCGGTHVRATGDIGSFKITADEAIASGVRRIRAVTGFDAFKRFREDERLIDESLSVLKTQRDQLPAAIGRLQDELKKNRKEIDDLKLKIASGAVGSSASNGDEARDVSGVKVMARVVEDLDKGGMRHLSDTLMAQVKSGVVVIGNKGEGKVSFIVRVSDDLTGKVKAGNIIKEIAPIVGGRGGGRPDMAEGGGSEPENLDKAIDASYGAVEEMLG
ncbi:MAG: alanine--tRNA ligase [Pyrinomonadaceae bacterium]|nr:alanine--tRNA ligase [Pyrinomonadaceae bacterium]